MLNLPRNPTGGTGDARRSKPSPSFAWKKICSHERRDYSELNFEGVHTGIASLPGMKERVIFLHGFSKALRDDRLAHWLRVRAGTAHQACDEVHQYSMLWARPS